MEKGDTMDLRKNLYDNIKECEIKIGYREEEIGLYYPEGSLLELLSTDRAHLSEAVRAFTESVRGELGEVTIAETQEEGRYCITIPPKGVSYVHDHVEESPFLKAFIRDIKIPGNTLEGIIDTFRRFSGDIRIDKEEPKEWAVSFCDAEVDPYVYHIEEDDFGLEYHRFTHAAYERLKEMK